MGPPPHCGTYVYVVLAYCMQPHPLKYKYNVGYLIMHVPYGKCNEFAQADVARRLQYV